MKKIFKSLLFLTLLLVPATALADGNISVSPSSLEIEVGETKSFTITAYNTIGDVTITSNNSSIATVSSNDWSTGMVEEKQTKTGTITVTGVSVGTTSITLTLDAATFGDDDGTDAEDLSGQTRTVNITVKKKADPIPEPTPTPTPDPTPTPTPSPSNNNSGSNSNTNSSNNNSGNTKKEEKSTNNKIKELTIEGQKIEKIDENNYTSTVLNNITSVNIKVVAENSKAKVTGDGKKNLKLGENTFEVVVTSESGATNKILVKVTRKDAFYL